MLTDTQQARSPEETRSRILAATRALIAKKGRRGTTTREIAELAGVNEATLFRHFGSKDAIIATTVEHFCPTVELAGVLTGLNGDLESDLRVIGRSMLERMEQVRDLIVMSLVEEEAGTSVDDAAWRAPSAIKILVADYMAKRVQSGGLAGDPQLLARFFMGMIFAQVIGRKKFPEIEHSTEEILDFQINTFLNGVRKK